MEEVGQCSYVKGKYMTQKRWEPPSLPSDVPIIGIKGTPLFDLLAVKIYWSGDCWPGMFFKYGDEKGTKIEHLEIYGDILLIDDKGNEFALFHRDFNNAEKVLLDVEDTNVSITLEKFLFEYPRYLPATFCLVFHLKEIFQNTLVANQVEFIDTTTTQLACAYDQLHKFDFTTEFAYVDVEYTIFQCALLACVGLVVEKIGENETDEAEISGTLTSSFKVHDGSCFEHVLSKDHSFRDFGNFIKLAIFGVPAYSWLYINANVDINGEKFVSSDKYLEFDPRDTYSHIAYEKELVGQNFRLRILVRWGHPHFFLKEAQLCQWLDRTRTKVHKDFNWKEEEKSVRADRLIEKSKKRLRCINQRNFQLISIQPRLEPVTFREWTTSTFPNVLVEVFSISVCAYGAYMENLDIYGTINVMHALGELRMFDRDEKNPKELHSYEPIPLVSSFDYSIRGPNFSIKVDLKDRVRSEICNGYVVYDFSRVANWVNERLCSTIRGEHGFATVHHTIFSDAVQAKLKFILNSDSHYPIEGQAFERIIHPTEGQAFGRIIGKYGNFRYDTHYDKKFFQITLFDKDEECAVKVDGSEIPLSKYVVAVPLNGSLVVTAHISVLTRGGGVETLKYTYEATYDSENPKDSKTLSNKIQGSNLRLSMFVEWE